MGSSRFPGKTLAPLYGRPMLERMIERLRRADRVDQIVVATTVDPDDDAIEELCRSLNVGCFRGSIDDVLSRVLRAAIAFDAELIVEMCGDCPLADPAVIDDAVNTFINGSYDYVSTFLEPGYPVGVNAQVFPTSVLAEVASLTDDPNDREHVSLYIYEHPQKYRLHHLAPSAQMNRPDVRLTVDTMEDLALIERIFERLYPVKPAFDTRDVIALLDREPELLEVNAHVVQKSAR